jgi:glycosyltransferase involved in cell wall biosynthesis
MSATSLAIAVPQIGLTSETFVRRHVEHLLPDRTVVLTREPRNVAGAPWHTSCPVLTPVAPRSAWHRIVRSLEHARGMPPDSGRTRRFLSHHRVEAMMGEYLDFALCYLGLARRIGARFYAHAHGYDVSKLLRDAHWRAAYRRLNDADGVITVSAVTRDRLVSLGLDAATVHVVPCGVDVPPEISPRREAETVRCIAVGRMVAKKAPILLLDAFRRAHEVHPRLRLDYVGGGPLLAAARQFVQSFRLEHAVKLHGWQINPAVQGLLAGADIFLQHSIVDDETGDEEGLPVALLEGMATGLPVVATRHGGIPEAVEHGATGMLVAEGDVVDMAAQIVRLAMDHDLRIRLGHAAWVCARERFTWERERQALLEIMRLQA